MLLKLKEVLFMNKRGQSLIIFVLLLPIIILFAAFLIDSSLSIMEKNKIDGIITSNMENSLNKDIRDIEKIKKAIAKNGNMETSVNIVNNQLVVKVKSTKKSVFGKILNFSWYNLEFNYCGNYLNKKIDKKCG